MRITVGFFWDIAEGGSPIVVSAFDDYTEDAWNGIPDFFTEEMAKYDGSNVRVAFFDVPDDEVSRLFATTNELHATIARGVGQ